MRRGTAERIPEEAVDDLAGVTQGRRGRQRGFGVDGGETLHVGRLVENEEAELGVDFRGHFLVLDGCRAGEAGVAFSRDVKDLYGRGLDAEAFGSFGQGHASVRSGEGGLGPDGFHLFGGVRAVIFEDEPELLRLRDVDIERDWTVLDDVRFVEDGRRIGREFAEHAARPTVQPVRERFAIDEFERLQRGGLIVTGGIDLIADGTPEGLREGGGGSVPFAGVMAVRDGPVPGDGADGVGKLLGGEAAHLRALVSARFGDGGDEVFEVVVVRDEIGG